MECKNCRAPLEEGQQICPLCGAEQITEEPEVTEESIQSEETFPVEEGPEEIPAEDISENSEDQDAPEAESDEVSLAEGETEAGEVSSSEEEKAEYGEASLPEEEMPKEKSHGWIWGLVGLLLMAALVCFAILFGQAKEPEEQLSLTGMVNYSAANEEITEDVSNLVVASVEKKNVLTQLKKMLNLQKVAPSGITNHSLQIQYWLMFYNFYEENYYYLSYMNMDPLHMETGNYDENTSWQEYFLAGALEVYRTRTAVLEKAKAEGFTLSAEKQEELESTKESLLAMEGIEDSLYQNFGPGVTVEDYISFMEDSALYSAYYENIRSSVTCTDEEAEAYFDANPDQFDGKEKTDKGNVSIRHILIAPTDTEDQSTWTAAEETANKLYEQWKSGDATEDSFAALATENSEDPGSAQNGGLMENVAPGQTVEAFNDWCFEDGREAGDTGVVKTEYGYHIIYFVSSSEEVQWLTDAREACINDKITSIMDEIVAPYSLTLDLANVKLGLPGQMETMAAMEAENSTETAPAEDTAAAAEAAPAEEPAAAAQ